MAATGYKVKYRFEFVSQGHKRWRIDISQRGFTGAAATGRLGAAPVYSMRRNGRIFATSMSFSLEAQTAGDFLDIAASQYKEFMAELVTMPSGLILWRGFIVPEEYSALERPAPYDLEFTASDCIADLKDVKFDRRGRDAISSILYYLLSPCVVTGEDVKIFATSLLTSNLDDSPNYFFRLNIDIDHLAGRSRYDVLQSLLETFNATIQRTGSGFHLIREIDIDAQEGAVHTFEIGPGSEDYDVPLPFGQMASTPVWPIGALTATMEPPHKSVTVTAMNEYIEATDKVLISGDVSGGMLTISPGASATFAFRIDPNAEIPGHNGYCEFYGLLLRIGAVAVFPFGTSNRPHSSVLTVFITIKDADGRRNFYDDIYRPSNGEVSRYWEYYSPSEPPGKGSETISIGQTEGVMSSGKLQYYDFPISSQPDELRVLGNYVNDSNVRVKLTNGGDIPITIDYDHISVRPERQDVSGNEVTVVTGNLARRAAEAAEILVPDKVQVGLQRFVRGTLTEYHSYEVMAETFSSRLVSSSRGLLTLIATELALEHYHARKRLSGKVQLTTANIPQFLREFSTGILYRVESLSLDLLLDEADVSMLSLTAAAVTGLEAISGQVEDKNEYKLRRVEDKMRQMGILFGIY